MLERTNSLAFSRRTTRARGSLRTTASTEDGSASGANDTSASDIALQGVSCNMQLRYTSTCRVIVLLCAKGSNPINIPFGMQVTFLLDLVSTGHGGSCTVCSNLHTGHPSPDRVHSSRLFWHRVAELGEVGRALVKVRHAKRGQG